MVLIVDKYRAVAALILFVIIAYSFEIKTPGYAPWKLISPLVLCVLASCKTFEGNSGAPLLS